MTLKWWEINGKIESLVGLIKRMNDEEIRENEEELNKLARLIDARLQDVDIGR